MTTLPDLGPIRGMRCHCWILVIAILIIGAPRGTAWGGTEFPTPHVIERVDSGVIDWSRGTVHAIGVSSPLVIDDTGGGVQERVLNGARADAYERVLLTARHVRIRPDLTIGQVMDATPRIAAEFRTLVQNLPVANQQYLSDGTVSIELMLPLYGSPAQLLLPEEIRQVQPIQAMATLSKPKTPPAPAGTNDAVADQQPYTGWVLDARSTGARAAMTIAVRDEGGRTVYGAAFVSREFAVHSGMTGYTAIADSPSAADRVGTHPMRTRVLRAVGETRCDLVISNADAARLRSAVKNLPFLRECRVLVVLDPQP